MKFYLISDNTDTLLGMRLAGIDGRVVHESDELKEAIDAVRQDPEIGILLLTEKLSRLCPDIIRELKLNTRKPLLVEIPDRHGEEHITASLEEYISEAIGLKFQ